MKPSGPVLRDIHPPAPPPWWPPAYGWWILAGAVLLAALAIVLWRTWGRTRRRRWRQVRGELMSLCEGYAQSPDPAWLAPRLSQLLRRAARLREPRAASAPGAQWIGCIRKLAPDEATARALEPVHGALYQRHPVLDGDAALAAARRWLRHVVRGGRA